MPRPNDVLVYTLHRLLSTPGASYTVRQVMEFLNEDGFEVDIQSVQRLFKNLIQLQERGLNIGLTKKAKGKTYSYLIETDSPFLTGVTQNSLKMLLSLLTDKLPESQRFQLQENAPGLSSFLERIYVAPESVLLPAEENAQVIATVYQAIQKNQYLNLHYLDSRLAESSFEFYPLGVMFRGQNSYLIGNKEGEALRTLAMYRIQTAECLPKHEALHETRVFQQKSFRQFCETQGLAGFFTEQPEMILLKLHFFKSGGHLQQMKLADDQQLVKLPVTQQKFPEPSDPSYFEMEVTATVADGRKLQEWILSFGDEVEVIAPLSLRERIQNLTTRMQARYVLINQEGHPNE